MAVDRIIWKIILDFLVLACVSFPLLALLLWGEPYERGYFENDLSLRLPFKEQTISEGLLAGLGFAFIICTFPRKMLYFGTSIHITRYREYYQLPDNMSPDRKILPWIPPTTTDLPNVKVVLTELVRDKQGKGVGEKFLSGNLIAGWIWESYRTIGIFTFGAACQQLTSNLAKYVIGRLRPHFYDVCGPVPNATSPLNSLDYIQDFTCSGTNAARLKEMRLSFPSAHSSFAMYCALFFIFYVQVKGKWRGSKLLRHGVQYVVLIAAWYVGLSRVVEHMHHWSDVAAGYFIGAAYAALVFVFILKPKKYGAPSWEQQALPHNTLPRPVLSR